MEVAMMVKRRALPSANKPPPTDNPNRLLAALPAADYTRILPSLTVVSLKLKTVLHKPGEPIQDVYFPGGGFCSMLTVLLDGSMVEIATIGREGMIGVSAILDDAPVTSTAMVQGATDICYRMKLDAFRREVDRRGAFHELLAHFAQARFGFVAQSTACNAIHSVEQRLARWLLMAQDRMGSDEFPLTQEFVATSGLPAGIATTAPNSRLSISAC
jgi:CRP-like cAMP-binding protein